MEKSFDFGRILKKHVKQKPVQFLSVSGGVKQRLEANLQNRKSTRLTVFDNFRDLSKCHDSPAALPHSKSKSEHRRLQLEKWKEEKEKQKKEAAAKKKKPFIVGVAHAPLKFVPPPPPKAMPSTSGRVTRSQVTKQTKTKVDKQTKPVHSTQSFAPINAPFRPPNFKCQDIPTLVPVTKKLKKTIKYDFIPVLPNTQKQTIRQTRSRTTNVKSLDTRSVQSSEPYNKTKSWVTKKPSPKPRKFLSKNLQSSSSSETEKFNTQQSSSEDDMVSSKLINLNINSKPIISSSSSDLDSLPVVESSPVLKITPRKSLSKATKLITPKKSIPKSESSSEEKLRSPKSSENTMDYVTEEAKDISPSITMSRGKDNARKETKKKLEEGLLADDSINVDSVDNFRCQLNSEIRRITERCDLWEKVQEETQLPESVQELVLAAVGQGRLLVAQKLRQFGALVESCAKPTPGAALITPTDLSGFWDMVFMQIENIDMRFKKLEELRVKNWVEEQEATKKRVPKVVVKKTTKAASGPSRLRDMIAAARKAKKEQELMPASPQPPAAADEGESKTFEAGFFSVKSPVRSPVIATPTRKPNLLKAVLSNEAKKSASKNSASFAMLRASVMSKNMEHEGIDILPQTPINLSATPARSILKSANTTSKKKRNTKSIKIVGFDDTGDAEDIILDNSEDNKENTEKPKATSSRKPKLVRQEATVVDTCGVMTRSRRKSMNTPQPFECIEYNTPKRSTRRPSCLNFN